MDNQLFGTVTNVAIHRISESHAYSTESGEMLRMVVWWLALRMDISMKVISVQLLVVLGVAYV